MSQTGQSRIGNSLPGHVPLVVGITGHRDLVPEDIPSLERKVGVVFQELQATYPHTPLVLLSPLAEGADSLVARVALRLGVRLLVPLPLPQSQYVKDFQTPESLAEFETLLSQAEKWYELPLPPGVTDSAVATLGAARDRQYEAAGLHIARASQILIAILEETAASDARVGGTAQTVSHRLGSPAPGRLAPSGVVGAARWARLGAAVASSGATCPDGLLDLADTGPVYHIACRRRNSPAPQCPAAPAYTKVYPLDPADPLETDPQAHFDAIAARTDEYNRDIARRSPRLGPAMADSRRGLVSDAEAARLSPGLQELRSAYAAADALAMHFQGTLTSAFRTLFLVSFAAVTCFTLFVYCIVDSPFLLLMYPLLLGLAYLGHPPEWLRGRFRAIYRRCEWLPAHGKYLDYRALAEGLRVQFFWRLAGLSDSAGSHYLRAQKGEVNWISGALRNLSLLATEPARRPPSLSTEEGAALAGSDWVHAQSQWFDAKVRTQGRQLAKATSAARALIGVGVLAATGIGVALLVDPGFRALRIPGTEIRWMDSFHCLVGLSAVAGLFWLHYLEKLFCGEQVKQYQKMKDLFARADRVLAPASEPLPDGVAENALRELGKRALLENADWLLLHRERPPRVEAQ